MVLTIAVSVEIGMQVRNNRKKVNASSSILAEQIAEQIASNSAREEAMTDTYKDSYIVRAKSVAYIIEGNDLYMHSVVKMKTVADVVDVDEINVFNADGVIYAGTNPEYFGYNFDSGEQIGYFKPMLEDKKLEMCQEPEYNTAIGKLMMYACVWNEAGDRIYQIGISPERMVEEMEINSINSVVEDIPYRDAMTVMIADSSNGEIVGSTSESYAGINLEDIELYDSELPEGGSFERKAVVNGEVCYCYVLNSGEYDICVAQSMFMANQDIAVSTIIMVLFLVFAIFLLLYFINTAVDKVREQETMYLREVEKERASRLETTINNIMKDALDQKNTQEGIKIVVREVAKELGANACMLYAEDAQMGLAPINIQWKAMPDGTSEFVPVADKMIERDSWTWCISTDGNAVIYDIAEVKDISQSAFNYYNSVGTEKTAIISFINQYRAIGFMSISDPNLERMEDIAMVMKQMSKFVISLLKINAAFDKLTYLGYNDNLTHALNRRALDDRADRLNVGATFGLIFCDITGLKRMNDERGHDEGDKLIINSYKILDEEFGSNDVYRVGGDEFICLLEDISRPQLDDIMTGLLNKLETKGLEMSVGSAWTGDYTGDFALLEREADEDMYAHKIEYYKQHPELKREIFERRQSQEMRAMIDNLANAYPLVGTVNLRSGRYRIIKGREEVIEASERHVNFDDFVADVRARIFTSDSIKQLRDTAYIDNISEKLSNSDSYEYKYQLINGGWQQMTYQVTERENGTPVSVIFYANKVSDALAERLEQDLTIKNEYEMLEGLCYDYSIISIIDRKADKMRIYRYNDFPAEFIEIINKLSFSEVRMWYADNFVNPSEREKFLEVSDLDMISDYLTKHKSYTFTFLASKQFRNTENGSYSRFFFYKPDEETETYVFATRNATSEIDIITNWKDRL